MKRIIDGKAYNTETATKLCAMSCAAYHGDFNWHDTGLYQTRGGAFFLAGEGGPRSMWAVTVPNGAIGGAGIKPIDADEARELLELENEQDTLERLFGEAPEAGEALPYSLRLPPALKARLAEAAQAAGQSLNAYIVRRLEAEG